MVKAKKTSPKKQVSPKLKKVNTKKKSPRISANKIPAEISDKKQNINIVNQISIKDLQKSPKKHSIVLYRSLRPTEWEEILNKKGVKPQCDKCPSPKSKDFKSLEKDSCCKRTISQHVTSGSTYTSRYISTSLDENIVAMWASISADADGKKQDNIYLEAKIPFDGNKVFPITDYVIQDLKLGLGQISRNFAMSSKEVIVEDGIPLKNIKAAYRVRCISKSTYDKYPEGTFKLKNKPYEYHKLTHKKSTRKTPFYLLSWKIWDKKNGSYEKKVIEKRSGQLCGLTSQEKSMFKDKKKKKE